MYVNQTVRPWQIALTRLTYNKAEAANRQDDCRLLDNLELQKISNDHMELIYVDINDGKLLLIQNDYETDENYQIEFDLRQYRGYQGDVLSDDQNSGAYIFRPSEDYYDSTKYSKVSHVEVTECSVTSQMTFWLTGDEDIQGDAVVTVTLDDALPIIKYDVLMFGIPKNLNFGHEVTANFYAWDIQNNPEFFTDSNGLAMQRRILNYRPSFDIDIMKGGLNVTANYYPIVTAISINDTDGNQLTVMNDRSQGGSSIHEGRVELMQNRRLNVDDNRGVNQVLSETNKFHVGITVPATYYVQRFNRNKRDSVQRTIQQRQDQPPQQFFSFDTV
jgi:hypothetical protein